MAVITGFSISESNLKAESKNVQILVSGDSDAIFALEVTRSSDSRYYNFSTNAFESTVSSQSRLKKQSPGEFSVLIPAAASGDVYTVNLWGNQHFNTGIFNEKNVLAQRTITQVGNSQVSLTITGTGITNTSVGSTSGSQVDFFKDTLGPTITMKEKQITVTEAVTDYGYFITNLSKDTDLSIGTWKSNALYWQSGNYTANGGGTGSTSLVLTSVDGLVVGMQVGTINSVAQTELRAITAINTSTKTVTLDGAETWSGGHVILFRAYGTSLIKEVSGITLTTSDLTVRLGQISTTLDDEITSNVSEDTEFNVNGTRGISKGATVRFRGLEKSEDTGTATVVGVDSSANDGGLIGGAIGITNARIVASSDRPIRSKTKIYIDGSSNLVYLSGKIGVSHFPETNQNIYIDANKILTTGTAL
jgi:hypothetical protein